MLREQAPPVADNAWLGQYLRGLEALRDENYPFAITCFDDAIATAEEHWEPRYARAWARMNLTAASGSDGADPDVVTDLEETLRLGGDACPDASILLGRIEQHRDRRRAFGLLMSGYARTSVVSFQTDVVECLLAVLDDVEGCTQDPYVLGELETIIRAAGVAQSVENALLAEVVATRAQLAGDDQVRASLMLQLAALSPRHPRLGTNGSLAGRSPYVAGGAAVLPTFAEVAGIEIVGTFQNRMAKVFDLYFKNSDIAATRDQFRKFGRSPTGAYLMFGPSGCGKTYMVKSFVGEYRKRYGRELAFHELRLHEVIDKYVGETEKALSKVFGEARSVQPSIIFADEIESLAGSRAETGNARYLVAQTNHFLKEVDLLRDTRAAVLLFGCTNMLWQVDLALVRRFDDVIAVAMPNEGVRRDAFNIYIKQLDAELVDPDIDFGALAERSHGLTAGDIQKVVRACSGAMMMSGSDQTPKLTTEQLLAAIAEVDTAHHVQWVKMSVEALKNAGLTDRADEVSELYKPFLRTLDTDAETGPIRPLPETVWQEEPVYDLSLIRRRRG